MSPKLKGDDFNDENKNYLFKDGRAYTEDNVLVHNIFIYKIPRGITQESVLEYFSIFGDVTKVYLVSDKKRSRRSAPKVGFVHFVDPLSAAAVLKNVYHLVQMKRVYVKACDSWHQPMMDADDDNLPVIPEKNNVNGLADMQRSQAGAITLLQLNDDCLEYICKKLDLGNQVRFALSCLRFRNIAQMCLKLEYKTLVLDKLCSMTLWEIHELFKLVGANIETLIGSLPYKDRERILEFIGHDCLNVKCINLDSCKIKSACLHKLLEKMQHVTELQLHDCSVKDNAILAIKKLPKLEILHLTENYDLTGKHLDKLKNLKELNLYGCANIQSTYVVLMLQALTDLRHLNIQRCERMTSIVFNVMSVRCKNLEVLKMSCPDEHYENVARLPNLRHLEVAVVAPFMPVRLQFFVELAKHKANQLEYLKVVAKNCISPERAAFIARLKQLKTLICANNESLNDDCLQKFAELENLEELVIKNCRHVSNDGLLYLLRKCTKLRRINLQFCSKITDTFVYKAVEILKGIEQSEQQKRKEPLLLYVTKTDINEFVLDSTPYTNAASLLKLSFHVPLSRGLEENDVLDMLDFLDDDDEDDIVDDFMGDDDNDEDDYFGFDAYEDHSEYEDDLRRAYDENSDDLDDDLW